MNRNVVSVALVLMVTLVGLSACQPSVAPDTNRSASATRTTPATEAVDPKAVEAELIKLEREWAAAAETHNSEVVRRIVADDAVIVYPDGVVGTKADEVRLIESGQITADSWELVEPRATVPNPDTAYLTGRSILKNGKYKDPNAKRPIDISGEYRFLNIYVKRDGRWQVVASQTTKVANPVPLPSPVASPTASPAASPAATRAASPATSPRP
jgi:ketosteroid isomerase-like protein